MTRIEKLLKDCEDLCLADLVGRENTSVGWADKIRRDDVSLDPDAVRQQVRDAMHRAMARWAGYEGPPPKKTA